MARKRIRDLRKQLAEADKHSIITTFLDCNPAAAPHRELLYDPTRPPMRLKYDRSVSEIAEGGGELCFKWLGSGQDPPHG